MNRTLSDMNADRADQAVPLVHARSLKFFAEMVDELGGDPAELFGRVGIPNSIAADGLSEVGYRQLVELFELAANTLAMPDFGLRLAVRQGGSAMFGPLGKAMRNCATLGEVVQFACTHSHAHSAASGIWQMRSPSGLITIGHDILLDRLPHKVQAVEHAILCGHLANLELTGSMARPRRILFRHQPTSSLAVYRQHFGCEVRFGQFADATVYDVADFDLTIVGSDEQALQAALSFIEQNFSGHGSPLHVRTRGIITHFLGSDLCTNERVAAELGMHPRTLHRHLLSEGTSFQQIKDSVRRDLMQYLLQSTDLNLTNISQRLGFSEQSVMTRFCQHWFALAPSELRKRGKEARRATV